MSDEIRGLQNTIIRLTRELTEAREALGIFACRESWKLGGVCDPNSPIFNGELVAKTVLARLDAEEPKP